MEKLHVAQILLLFPQVVRHFPQLPDEFHQRLLVTLPSRQQLAAETDEVLFDLLQLTWGTASEGRRLNNSVIPTCKTPGPRRRTHLRSLDHFLYPAVLLGCVF